jgi:hypothetical protein
MLRREVEKAYSPEVTGVLKLLFPEHVSISGFTRDSVQKALEIVGFVYQEGVALWGSFRTMK